MRRRRTPKHLAAAPTTTTAMTKRFLGVGVAGGSALAMTVGVSIADAPGAHAAAACARPTAASVNLPDGTVIYPGNCWLGGAGVDVHGNGGDNTGYWQCVELPRRLFITHGWAPAGWAPGNGNQVWMAAGGGRVSQPQGSITYLQPGDAVSMRTFNEQGVEQPNGHVAVVNTVTPIGDGRYAVQLVQQNTYGANVFDGPTWDGHNIRVPSLGWSYQVVGVLHRPSGALGGGHVASAGSSAGGLGTEQRTA